MERISSVMMKLTIGTLWAGLVVAPAVAGGTRPAHAGGTNAPAMVVKQSNGCTAKAPEDWTMVAGPQGAGVDMLSGDQKAYAGWYILPIHRAMQAWYGNAYGDPSTSMAAEAAGILAGIGDFGFHYTSDPRTLGYFTMRAWSSDKWEGVFFYHLYGIDGISPYVNGADYIESVYCASTQKGAWAGHGRLALQVAASIRGQVHLHVTTTDVGVKSSGGRGEKKGSHSEYNAQLGTDWVHDPNTGESFMVDYVHSWNENGADGPGYYKTLPDGSHVRLEEGSGD